MSPTATRMWNRYCQLRAEAALRDHLGVTAEEWADQPAEFAAWASHFKHLVEDRHQRDHVDEATREQLRGMLK